MIGGQENENKKNTYGQYSYDFKTKTVKKNGKTHNFTLDIKGRKWIINEEEFTLEPNKEWGNVLRSENKEIHIYFNQDIMKNFL